MKKTSSVTPILTMLNLYLVTKLPKEARRKGFRRRGFRREEFRRREL